MIAALFVLSVIILFHEFGHFLFARLNGVAVVEFSLGFGPRLFSFVSKKSGTRYSVKCLPLGGSCAMLGEEEAEEEDGDAKGPDGDEKNGGGFAGGPADDPDRTKQSFFAKSPLARISVIAAGPFFNFILAFFFAVVILSWAGIDAPRLAGVSEGQAAEAAGLREGDVITRLGSRKIYLARDITMYMLSNGSRSVSVGYKRFDGAAGVWRQMEATIRPSYDSQAGGRYLLGVQLGGTRTAASSIPELLKYGLYEVRFWILSVTDSLKMMVRGQVDSDDIAGPVRIVTIINDTVEENIQYGFVTVLMNLFNLMVMFSANLGVMNLLPLPALDGGRLVFLAWELLTRKPVNQRIENAVNLTGMALLMTFMVFVIFNDIRNIF